MPAPIIQASPASTYVVPTYSTMVQHVQENRFINVARETQARPIVMVLPSAGRLIQLPQPLALDRHAVQVIPGEPLQELSLVDCALLGLPLGSVWGFRTLGPDGSIYPSDQDVGTITNHLLTRPGQRSEILPDRECDLLGVPRGTANRFWEYSVVNNVQVNASGTSNQATSLSAPTNELPVNTAIGAIPQAPQGNISAQAQGPSQIHERCDPELTTSVAIDLFPSTMQSILLSQSAEAHVANLDSTAADSTVAASIREPGTGTAGPMQALNATRVLC